MNVLLLEPYTGMRVMIRGVLKTMGIENLHEPRTSLEAMHILLNDQVDFFICSDTVKPLDAILCIKLIRAAREDHIRHIRTIVSIDGYSDDQVKALIDAGCDDILKKPFSANSMRARFHRLMRNRAAFIECKSYVGPDRRKWQVALKQDERRDEMRNAGKALFNHSLRKLIQRLFDLRDAKKDEHLSARKEELKARGILMDDDTREERELTSELLQEGMALTKVISTDTGMAVLPLGSVLSANSISRLKDLARCGRIDDVFSVLV